jgi:uncharacterized protein YyaL (SSP411 family)
MSPAANRLADETSPYLRQHAHNPVDWYPWGDEALRHAKELDRPIFLSIGYSACHWCHVMEHESFEDPAVADVLNRHFVSIKVDREERPDLDQIYMTAVQMLTGQGGWPMSMFLTPDLEPFYGGTYFPPDDRYGRPSFKRLLQHLIEVWQNRRADVDAQAKQLSEGVRQSTLLEPGSGPLDTSHLRRVLAQLQRRFDPTFGGFGDAPKFPHPIELRLLLRLWKRFNDADALNMATQTLNKMAQGGIYDHLGGGFHRYSTDQRWLVPHFEKMLYDNALLAVAYLEAFQATAAPAYRTVIEETLDYVLREMTSPEGPFYSTQDADSEGEEGKFFVWSLDEVEQILGRERAELFCKVFDVTREGNWEGHNILHRGRSDEQEARMQGISKTELRQRFAEAKTLLFEVRSKRIWPGRDEKVLTSWNGLMITALARAGAVLDVPRYTEAAARAAEFIWVRMRTPDGRLLRTYSTGTEPKLNGYLEDFAFLLDALVALYEATFEVRWIERALELSRRMSEQFWDAESGGFFYTGRDHEALIARTKDPHDSSIPSGNGMAATALLHLHALTGNAELLQQAETTMRLFHGLMTQAPMAVGQMLMALDFYLGPVQEYAVIGDPADAEVRRVLSAIRRVYRPHHVLALKPTGAAEEVEKVVPLLADRPGKGRVTFYVCENFTCQAPLVGAEAAEKALHSPQTSPSTSSAT